MGALNYFSVLCFAWALMGIGSRFVMVYLGQRWNKWELDKVYSEEKPSWIYFAGVAALALVGFTWFKVFTSDVAYSWVIAILITLTLIKISILIFQYSKFRVFAKTVLNDQLMFMKLNIGVVIFSIVFILLGIFLY